MVLDIPSAIHGLIAFRVLALSSIRGRPLLRMAGAEGFKPSTFGVKGRCSTVGLRAFDLVSDAATEAWGSGMDEGFGVRVAGLAASEL